VKGVLAGTPLPTRPSIYKATPNWPIE
jgi:hypothetical protein